MQRDRALLYDILESARLAVSYIQEVPVEDFLGSLQLQDAVTRRVEIIGEAAGSLSEETKSSLPNLPWRDMTDMRNFLVHQYGDVDPQVVWDTVKLDLPPLITALERLAYSK